MKEFGRMIKEMEKGLRDMPMAILTLVTLVKAKLMGREFTPGKMEKCLMVSGTKDLNMVMEYGKEFMEIHL